MPQHHGARSEGSKKTKKSQEPHVPFLQPPLTKRSPQFVADGPGAASLWNTLELPLQSSVEDDPAGARRLAGQSFIVQLKGRFLLASEFPTKMAPKKRPTATKDWKRCHKDPSNIPKTSSLLLTLPTASHTMRPSGMRYSFQSCIQVTRSAVDSDFGCFRPVKLLKSKNT